MASEPTDKYKVAEKAFRNVKNYQELLKARKLLSTDFRLFTEPTETQAIEVCENIFLYRGYLNATDQAALATHLVTQCIDHPHSNSLSDSTTSSMWQEYQSICLGNASELHTSRLRRLRWSCMGYHYDWTNRSYSPDRKSNFAETDPIQALYREVATKPAESVIINLYHSHRPGDRLGGHRDDCEESLSPLLLVSLGLPGLLLLGDDCGVLLRSGDAIVFKDSGRFALHGIPCVFSGPSSPPDGSVEDLLLRTRISLSIRCVW